MKRTLAIFMVLVLFFLCACGAVKLTPAEVEDAFGGSNYTLEMETSGDKVKSFTIVVEEVNAENLVDRQYAYEAIYTLLADSSQLTGYQYDVCLAFVPLMEIQQLFGVGMDEENFDPEEYVEGLMDVICDEKAVTYSGWKVTPEIDQARNSITYTVSR